MPQTDVVTWDRSQLGEQVDAVLDVYADAMQVDRSSVRTRRTVLRTHLDRDGLQTVAALEAGTLVGIAYGYRGAPGQWWHDQVSAGVGPDAAARWLTGSFEVCELHVRTARQGAGTGRTLLDTLLAATDARTAVLSTPDNETRARGFYRAGGWRDLVTGLVFPGDPRTFAVLAKDL